MNCLPPKGNIMGNNIVFEILSKMWCWKNMPPMGHKERINEIQKSRLMVIETTRQEHLC